MIERVENYKFDGGVFDSLPKVAKFIENEIGKIIDSTPNRLSPSDALAVYEAIVKHRVRLCHLLSARFRRENDDASPEEVSIFDL